MKTSKQEVLHHLRELRAQYESGNYTLAAGLCFALISECKITESLVLDIMDSYPITEFLGEPEYTKLGPCGHFTEARYDFLGELIHDLLNGDFDYLWLVEYSEHHEDI